MSEYFVYLSLSTHSVPYLEALDYPVANNKDVLASAIRKKGFLTLIPRDRQAIFTVLEIERGVESFSKAKSLSLELLL
jgi:hypothetical protein